MNNSPVNLTITESITNSSTYFIGSLSAIELCTSIINLIFGLPTQSCVIWLIITETGISTDFFTLNVSICEIGVCLDSLFTILSYWYSSLKTLNLFFSGLGLCGRPMFQCLICVERYLAVVHPVTFLKYKPLRYKAICSTAVWIISLGFCLTCMFTLVSFRILVYAWFFAVPLVLFISIKLFCCVAVLRALNQSGPGEKGKEKEEGNHTKKRVFHHILVITVTMVVIYLPFILVGYIYIFTNQLFPALWFVGFICYGLSGFVQPVLYLLRLGKLPCFPKP